MDGTQAPPDRSTASAASYTAVIHVHGMGSQRRFEEASALVDALDLYANVRHRERQSVGKLVRIQARSEPSRTDPEETRGYVRGFWTKREGEGWTPYQQVRFHEVYWAPVMAGQQSPWRTLRWIFAQALRPWRTVLTPWRERQRLRRAALAQLFADDESMPSGALAGDFAKLVCLYDDFEGLAAQRSHRAGHFGEFVEFIRDRRNTKPDAAERLVRVARAWRRRYLANELRAAGVLLTIALGLLLGALGAIYLVLTVLRLAAGLDLPEGLAPDADWKTAAGLTASLLLALGPSKFRTDYLGDVEAWSTYLETDEKHERRRKVLEVATDTIRHVLADERCARVVVTAHSLGSTVAHDALLEIARTNRATNPQDPMTAPFDLGKIEHFVTFGSPIDKIEYFFESFTSSSHRYKRVVEELRGDIGTEPFSRNRKPHVNWINFWDEGDVISGPLQSPINRRQVEHRVQNVHVRHFLFPAPAASHVSYLKNRAVIGALFDIVFFRKWSIKALPSGEGAPPDYREALVPGSEPTGDRAPLHWVALLIPWLALIGALVWIFGDGFSLLAFVPALIAAAALGGSYVVSRLSGHRNPVEPRSRPGGRDEPLQ